MKLKRTYNLSEQTVNRVRELSERYRVAPTQDAVVEAAVERLYRLRAAEEEANAWARASEDEAFRREIGAIDREFAPAESRAE